MDGWVRWRGGDWRLGMMDDWGLERERVADSVKRKRKTRSGGFGEPSSNNCMQKLTSKSFFFFERIY